MEEFTETRIISLNSLYANSKINDTYNSNVIFNFKNILKDEPDIIRSNIQIINALIPVSYYCINYTNDIFKIRIGLSPPFVILDIPITRGNYNSSNLITELKSKLITARYTFTITISRITGIMTFNYSNIFFIYNNPLGVLLGFNTTLGSSNIGGVDTLTAPYPLNLLGIKKIKIYSNSLSTYSFDSYGTGNNNIITTIPITAPPFGLIVFNQYSNPLILRQKTINEIDIKLLDEDNEFINFNNINWSITLQLNIIRIRQSLTNQPKTISDIINAQLDKDIQALNIQLQNMNNNQNQNDEPVDNSQNDNNNEGNNDEIDPTNTLDFLQYNKEI